MKTKPHTIRFEERDYEFICKREGIKTAQSIVNFLLSNYLKLYRVEKKSVFDVKEEIKESYNPVQTKSVNYFDTPKQQKVKTLMDYVNDRIECDNQESYNKWLTELNNDTNLSQRQKELAKTSQP